MIKTLSIKKWVHRKGTKESLSPVAYLGGEGGGGGGGLRGLRHPPPT